MQRNIFQCKITKNIKMFSHDSLIMEPRQGELPHIQLKNDRPLVVLLSWLNAKPKHTKKFVDLYMNKGFDVLNVETFMWHLLWPIRGSQVTASNILEFIHENKRFQPILVHGLSSGTYVWSEVLVKVAADIQKYEKTINRVKGQIFDSPPSAPPEFQKAFAKALFVKIPFLSYLFENSLTFYLFICNKIVTKHLKRAYEAAHNPPVKIPSLMFISKDDLIAPFQLNMNMFHCWKKNGLAAFVKCWDKSRHIGHYHYHQEEYMNQLNLFLEFIGLNNLAKPNRIKSKI
ncbi:uncharacterized protein [Halyomorpha halys]|nr:uncharacterized protein LOC106678543 isoform X2 [Halyomorpha halys]